MYIERVIFKDFFANANKNVLEGDILALKSFVFIEKSIGINIS